MRIRLFLMFFCVLLCVGEVSAQKNWIPVDTPGISSIVGDSYIDYTTIRRLPDGNVTYWSKNPTGDIYQTEVNCVAKEQRTLKVIRRVRTDSYGNKIDGGGEGLRAGQMEWRAAVPTSINDNLNGIACSSAKNIAPQSDKPVVKKKVVKGTRKRKQ